MNIETYGHYYKHKRHTDIVERITVIEILPDGYAVCVKGHISPTDRVIQRFNMPIKKIKTVISNEEKAALAEFDKYKKQEKKSKQAAKKNKELQIKEEIRMFKLLQEKLFEKHILVPILCDLTNEEMEKLLQEAEEYIPEIGKGLYVKVYAYDEDNDRYMWCFA